MSLGLGTLGADQFLRKKDREDGEGLSCFSSESGYAWGSWKD